MKTKAKLAFTIVFGMALQWAYAQWMPFCTGNTNGFIVEFDRHDGELYATGLFTRIGGVNARYLARWSETLQVWQQVGAGLPDAGHALHSHLGGLQIAAYRFAIDSNYVHRWNPDFNILSRLGDGFYFAGATGSGSSVPSMYDLVVYNDFLVVCGEFNRIQSQPAGGVAYWNGQRWLPMGSGVSGNIEGSFPGIAYPHKMLAYGGSLYVVGNFRYAGGVEVNGVARWNGAQWEAMGAGFNGPVYGIEEHNGEIYVGGSFTMSGDTPLGSVAKWNGAAWISPGVSVAYANPSVTPYVHTVKSLDGRLYLLGGFNRYTTAGAEDQTCGSLLAWDGDGWDNLGGGVNGEAEAIIEYDGALLIGGTFTSAGGVAVNSMALWQLPTSTNDLISSELPCRVYPNPACEWVVVALPEDVKGTFSYQIIDAAGKILRSGATAPDQQIITSGLPSGRYSLLGHCERGNFAAAFVVR